MNGKRSCARLGALGLIAAGILVGCNTTGSSPVVPGSSAGVTPSTTATPSGSPGSALDPRADVTPGYIDILDVAAAVRNGSLVLDMKLAAPVPASSVGAGLLAYSFALDTDGDGQPDATASLRTVPEGGFQPVLVDSTGSRAGPAFPGTANLAGAEIEMTVTLDAIGCPATVAVRGFAERTQGGATARDDAPDDPTAWLTVKTGC